MATNKHTHTSSNAVTLAWGSLRLAPTIIYTVTQLQNRVTLTTTFPQTLLELLALHTSLFPLFEGEPVSFPGSPCYKESHGYEATELSLYTIDTSGIARIG